MFKNRLKRYTGLIALITILITFVIVVIIGNTYLDTNIIQRDYFSASRIEVLDQTLNRIGPEDEQLRADILEHVHLLRDGGQLTSLYGPSWYKPPVSDKKILAAIADIDAANNAGDYQAFKEAYHNFAKVSAKAGFEALKFVELLQYLIVAIIILGFLGILGLLFFRLGRSDDRAMRIESENQQILSSVDDGLFLIDRNYEIGEQKSNAVSTLFGSAETMSGNFFDAMYSQVSQTDLDLARDFIDLLFEGRVLQDLVQDVNPLQEVEVDIINDAGGQVRKFLNFNFSRIENAQATDTLLVSVADVTKEVLLRRELETAKELQKERMNLFVGLLQVPREKLVGFCNDSLNEMREINAVLANEDLEDSRMRSKLNDIFRRAHRIKGDAATLGLSLFENSLHRFETRTQALQKLMVIDGRNVLELTVLLKDMIAETEMIRSIVPQLETIVSKPEETTRAESDAERADDAAPAPSAFKEPLVAEESKLAEQPPAAEPKVTEPPVVKPLVTEPKAAEPEAAEPSGIVADLQNLLYTVSQRQGKKVMLDVTGLDLLDEQDELSKSIRSFCIQLVRNSVVHGVEAPAQRAEKNKPSFGVVGINLRRTDDNGLQLIVRDDGQGLQYEAIRARALQANLLTAEQAESIKDTALLKYIFMPGFSSVEQTDVDAGRGVGLDFVRAEMKRLGGKLSVSSKAGAFTKFVLTLPAAA